MSLKHLTVLSLPLLFWASPLRADQVTGAQVQERTTKVLESIQWGNELSPLLEKAKKEKKLVFWLQLVGNLDGGL